MSNPFLGSDLDDFLQEEGMLEHCQAVAVKRVLSYQLQMYMDKNEISKTEMAERLKTSRMGLNRLLNAENTSITLDSMVRAANAVGGKLSISLAY
ncbi:MAG: XRE family transcriptional regulator [Methylococcales bacterium]